MDTKQAEELFKKYLSGKCTPEELLLIKRAYNNVIPKDTKNISEERFNEMKLAIWNNIDPISKTPVNIYKLWPRIAAAALILITCGLAGYFYFSVINLSKKDATEYANLKDTKENSAIIRLANGKTINLSNVKTGVVISASSLRYEDGTEIAHVNNSSGNNLNMISTSRGKMYLIELPDGTKAFLNASSSLKFPSSFSESPNRRVELIGEGYFEVAKDKKHPFIVRTDKEEIKVLGTHFNINSYPDEVTTKTTLIEGSVEIRTLTDHAAIKRLTPGQQAIVKNNHIEISNVDTDSALGWKDGDFIFNDDIKTIMREISRWYDVEITYKGVVSEKEYIATFSRSKKLEEILKALEITTHVHFKIEGRRVTVMS